MTMEKSQPPSHDGARDEGDARREEQDGDDNLPHGLKLVVIFASLVMSILLVALDTTIIATAIPHITDEFHSLDQVGWYGSAYFLTNSAFQSVWGKAYTYFDMKTTFNVGIGLFEIGTLICALAGNSNTFIAGRAVAGLGGAALGSGAFSIVATIAPPKKRPMYMGFMGCTYGVASVIGPILGGFFTQYATGSYYAGWRWCFWINLPIGALASTIVLFLFRAPQREVQALGLKEKFLHMDLLGAFVLLGSLVCYLLPMRWGGVSYAWSSAPVVGTLVASGVLLVLFIAIEWRSGDKAMLQTRFFKNGEIVMNWVYMFALSGLYMPAVYFISIQFQALGDKTPAQAGIQLIPLALTVSIGTIVTNICVSKFGHAWFWLVLGPVFGAAGSALMFTLGGEVGTGPWIGFQILIGFGVGFALQTPLVINQSLVAPHDIPIIVGITLFFEEVGYCVLISACEAAFDNRLVASLIASSSRIDPTSVVQAGASQLRTTFSSADLPSILVAYQDGLNVTSLLVMACGGLTLLVSLIVVVQDKTRILGCRKPEQETRTEEEEVREKV